MGWLTHVEFWHWWVLAGVLLVLELTSPVFFFLWLGFAAAAVGFLLLVFPSVPIGPQLVLFALLSCIAVVAWRRYPKIHLLAPAHTSADPAGRGFAGRILELSNPIEDGVGTEQIDGSTCRIQGPDLPAGARVRVVAADDGALVVEIAEAG